MNEKSLVERKIERRLEYSKRYELFACPHCEGRIRVKLKTVVYDYNDITKQDKTRTDVVISKFEEGQIISEILGKADHD